MPTCSVLPSGVAHWAHECHLQTLNGQFVRHNKALGEMLFHLDGQISVLLSVKHHTHNAANGQPRQTICLSNHLCHWKDKSKPRRMKNRKKTQIRRVKSKWIMLQLSWDLPVVFPDLGGPRTAILTGKDGVGLGCLRYFKGLSINVLRFSSDAKT